MRNIEAGNSLCENVATDSNRAQRGKLLERKFHHCVSSKSQNPNSKQTANHQISKGLGKGGACPTKVNPQYQFGTSDLRIGWDFGFTSNTKFAFFQARLGKAQRFLGLLDIFFLALDQLTVLQQI